MAKLKLWNIVITQDPTPKETEEGGEHEDGRILFEAEKVQAPDRDLALIKAIQDSETKIAINARVQVQVSPF